MTRRFKVYGVRGRQMTETLNDSFSFKNTSRGVTVRVLNHDMTGSTRYVEIVMQGASGHCYDELMEQIEHGFLCHHPVGRVTEVYYMVLCDGEVIGSFRTLGMAERSINLCQDEDESSGTTHLYDIRVKESVLGFGCEL